MLRLNCTGAIVVVAVGAFVGWVGGCSKPGDGAVGGEMAPAAATTGPSERRVTIDSFAFEPASLVVAAGTKVTWLNRDDVPHTATSSERPRKFDSKALDTDETFSQVFTEPGKYPYFCAVHPHMTGQIVVK
jgi:plastocyanin